jgi:hypothetical protein
MSEISSLKGLIRESSRQNQSNVSSLEELQDYWQASPGNSNVKLESFAKYATRESLTKFLTRAEVFQKQLDVNG